MSRFSNNFVPSGHYVYISATNWAGTSYKDVDLVVLSKFEIFLSKTIFGNIGILLLSSRFSSASNYTRTDEYQC